MLSTLGELRQLLVLWLTDEVPGDYAWSVVKLTHLAPPRVTQWLFEDITIYGVHISHTDTSLTIMKHVQPFLDSLVTYSWSYIFRYHTHTHIYIFFLQFFAT